MSNEFVIDTAGLPVAADSEAAERGLADFYAACEQALDDAPEDIESALALPPAMTANAFSKAFFPTVRTSRNRYCASPHGWAGSPGRALTRSPAAFYPKPERKHRRSPTRRRSCARSGSPNAASP